ncbi:MAG: hypothetical protein GY906_12705 [bacterium]|nr:hypothetical protein [bacterium]
MITRIIGHNYFEPPRFSNFVPEQDLVRFSILISAAFVLAGMVLFCLLIWAERRCSYQPTMPVNALPDPASLSPSEGHYPYYEPIFQIMVVLLEYEGHFARRSPVMAH